MTAPTPHRYVDENEAAAVIGFSVKSLRNWRWRGEGPPYVVRGRSVRYSNEKLFEWMEAGNVEVRELIRGKRRAR
jgi:predicted DNA-binding transcriptional regulator AlpA